MTSTRKAAGSPKRTKPATKPPHIAYVCADRGVPVGGHKGASLHVAELVRALLRRGATVTVLAARVADAEAAAFAGATVIDVGGGRFARRAREALLHSPGAGSAAAAEAAAVMLNQDLARALDKLHRTSPVDAVYERYSLWSFAGAGFAKTAGIPFLIEVNAPLRDEQRRYRVLANEELAASLEHFALAAADRVLVPSGVLAPVLASRGARPDSVVVVPNAADPSLFRARRRPPKAASAARDEFVIGFVGSLKPWHGLDDLARVFRRLHRGWKGYRLLIVGDGPMRAKMEQTLTSQGLAGAVTFAGAVAHAEIPEWIAKMDAAVAPYPKDAPEYFSPIKIFEYMAGGAPVVASRLGQIAEVLSHRRTALLHGPGAIAEMAGCIEELRRRPALGAKLATAARSVLVRDHTWTKNADRVLREIRAVVRDRAIETGTGTGAPAKPPKPAGAGSPSKRNGPTRPPRSAKR